MKMMEVCGVTEIFPSKTFKVEGEGPNRVDRPKFYAGVVFVPKGTTYRRTYETAAWWTEIATTEDRWYPVFATRHHIYRHKFALTALVEAVCTSEYTPALYGGVPVGTQPQRENHRNVGRREVFSFTIMPDMVGEQFIPVSLGFVAVRCFYLHTLSSRDQAYNTETWEWRPYAEHSLERAPVLEGAWVSTYGSVSLK